MFIYIPAAGGNAQNVCRRITNSSWETKKDRARHLSPYIHPTARSLCLFITDSVQFPWSLHACTKTHTLLHTPINMHAYTMCVCVLEQGTFSHARDINPSNSMHDPFHMCVCLLFQPVYILWAQLIQCCCTLKPPLAAYAYTRMCTCIKVCVRASRKMIRTTRRPMYGNKCHVCICAVLLWEINASAIGYLIWFIKARLKTCNGDIWSWLLV